MLGDKNIIPLASCMIGTAPPCVIPNKQTQINIPHNYTTHVIKNRDESVHVQCALQGTKREVTSILVHIPMVLTTDPHYTTSRN